MRTAKKTEKVNFYSPEEKKKRYEARMALKSDHIVAINDNNSVIGKGSDYYVDEKAIKAADKMFGRLSLKELELLKLLFAQCEYTGITFIQSQAS